MGVCVQCKYIIVNNVDVGNTTRAETPKRGLRAREKKARPCMRNRAGQYTLLLGEERPRAEGQ